MATEEFFNGLPAASRASASAYPLFFPHSASPSPKASTGGSAIVRRMVRRDVSSLEFALLDESPEACCAFLTGESPVPVSAGAPGSRSQGEVEILRPRAGRRKRTSSGEKVRGP